MQIKIATILVAFIVFSLKVFSQSTKTSEHPLLDKYYPKKQADTSTAQTKSPPPTSTPTIPVLPVKPVNTPTAIVSKPQPVVSDTTVINKNIPVPVSKPLPVSDTTAIAKSAPLPVPVQKAIEAKPPSTPYMNNRLGSSTRQYDTWEKNSNGAGSVTTSPK